MIKTAILIDGAYFLKRLPGLVPDTDLSAPEAVADLLEQLVRGHLERLNEIWGVPDCYQLLYRGFYYDARPSGRRIRRPVSRGQYQHSATDEAQFRVRLFKALHGRRYFAVRLGEVGITPAWLLRGTGCWTGTLPPCRSPMPTSSRRCARRAWTCASGWISPPSR